MNYGMRFVTLYRRQGARPFPRKGKKAKCLSICKEETLQIAEKRERSERQRRKGKI